MSFSTDIKNEITKQTNTHSENIAELSAFYRNNAIYDKNHIELITENVNIAKRIYSLNKEIYQVATVIEKRKNYNFKKTGIYILSVNDKVNEILCDLSVTNEKGFYLLKPSKYIHDSEDDARAYLRGLFLAKGSINDPKTSRYHLEFTIDTVEEANFVVSLLNRFDLNAKIINRDKGYMVYLKEAEKIGDFIRIIQANQAVMYFEDIRIFRDHMNMTNRLNNCEQANTDRVVFSALSQIEDAEYLKEHIGLNLIDEKLKEAVNYRLKYPEVSLQELADIITFETGKKITKSGLNHRFRKLKEKVQKIKESSIQS